KPFAGAVHGGLLGDNLWTGERKMAIEVGAQILADVAHRIEIGNAAIVDPPPYLRSTHAPLLLGNRDCRQRVPQLGTRHAHWRGPRISNVCVLTHRNPSFPARPIRFCRCRRSSELRPILPGESNCPWWRCRAKRCPGGPFLRLS